MASRLARAECQPGGAVDKRDYVTAAAEALEAPGDNGGKIFSLSLMISSGP